MILGRSQFGEAILGSDLDEVSFKIYSEPDAVSVAVAVTSATMAVISTPTGATVTVTAFAPESNTGSNSFPEAASVTVTADRPRAGAKSLPPVVTVAVAGVAPTTLVVSEPPAVSVTVAIGTPTLSVISSPTGASVAVAGVAPTESVVVETPGASVAVAAGTPVAAVANSLVGIAVSVVASSPAAASSSSPTGAAITVTVTSPDTVALQVLPSAIVWVRTGVLVNEQEAAQGTIVVLNANTLAVSEYGIAALDMVEHEGELYFVTMAGLVKLAAGAGVPGSITTGDLELADGSLSLNLARLEVKADGELHLTATAHQDGGERSVRYLIPTRTGANDRNRNVKLGNGVLGNAWSFTIAPPTGGACNWSLSGWKIEPGQIKLRRR